MPLKITFWLIWFLNFSILLIISIIYFFDKRCVTLRDDTEWTELVENGVNTLVGSNKIKILQAYRDNINLNFGSIQLDIYGKGDASNKVVNELINF